MTALNDELLDKVSGGALKEADEDEIVNWLRLRKDMGSKLSEIIEQVTNEYNNKIDYYDLVDTDGKHVGLDDLIKYVETYWEEV